MTLWVSLSPPRSYQTLTPFDIVAIASPMQAAMLPATVNYLRPRATIPVGGHCCPNGQVSLPSGGHPNERALPLQGPAHEALPPLQWAGRSRLPL
ncbi:hypothetical protein B296_00027715 [Ensete ventricosum]|uniref:Uncharacterized protein n=1 Tax=Ensete ventricosum TaxID=4639 RepID=A0A426XVD2_ENSVE|nr:hypothetical protein B296_00027715 [Ensete ventricosum]